MEEILELLRDKTAMPFRVAYGKYLCRTWNGPGYEENLKDPGQLMSLKFIWHSEPVIWNESLDSKGGEWENGRHEVHYFVQSLVLP